MDERFRQQVLAEWEARDGAGDLNERPATESELREFEAEFGPIPSEFRWFLSACGGGPVGGEWVDGIAQLADSHRKFRSECGGPFGWSMAGVFVIGWDGGGNPFGINRTSGRLVVEDHQFGGIYELAPSFAAFLASGLSLSADSGDAATGARGPVLPDS